MQSTSDLQTQALAASLINTKTLPPGLSQIEWLSKQAYAYDAVKPYPLYWFKNWKEEDRGPLPRCMPIAKSIVRRGARWLFGKPVEIRIPGNEAWEERLEKAWQKNNMDSRLVALARRAGLEGGVVLKFAYDEMADPDISFQTLSIVSQVRLYYHPHNRFQLLMARIQYPYYDAAEGCTYWYREEWTAQEEVHYVPVRDDSMRQSDPDTYEGWEIASSAPNPFQLIPLVHIKNIETDDVWGAGDLWEPSDEQDGGLYRVLDRIHLTYHLMDRSNQFDSTMTPIYIDADVDQDDINKPLLPGQPVVLESMSDASNGHQAKVEFPPTGNALRPAMMDYAKDLRRMLLSAASSVDVDPTEFTNKGNLTNAVMVQLYLPQIEVTEDKRKTYGQNGLVPFLAAVAIGLQKAGVDLGVNPANEDTYTAELKWAPYFELSEDEKAAKTARMQEEELAGYVPHDRAIEEISQMEGRTEIEQINEELASQAPPPVVTMAQSAQEQQVQDFSKKVGSMRRIGGPNAQ